MINSKALYLLLLSVFSFCLGAKDKPNLILIFTDDQGYGDLSCFGSKKINTPHIDRIAKEGRKFTSFMVASPVCTPSRAALLTGCYPKRVGMHQHVLFPSSTKGLNPKEYTLADHFKSINDSYGHLIGDEALIAITRRIRQSVRAHDIVGRIGGEEFAVYLRGAGKDDAFLVADRIRKAVADLVFEPEAGRRHPLTVSIGGVVEAQDLPLPEALRRADSSLYAAKNGGRNLVVIDGAGAQAA